MSTLQMTSDPVLQEKGTVRGLVGSPVTTAQVGAGAKYREQRDGVSDFLQELL